MYIAASAGRGFGIRVSFIIEVASAAYVAIQLLEHMDAGASASTDAEREFIERHVVGMDIASARYA